MLTLAARAFARAGLSWDDALVVSASGAAGGSLRRAANVCRAHPKVAVLAAPGAGPAELGRELFPQTPRSFIVCEGLGGPRERVVHVRPAEATTRPWRDPEVVLVLDPRAAQNEHRWIAGAVPGPPGWALPDGAFASGDAPGPDGRASALARLGPRVGDMVWGLGAGAGPVAIECARLGAAAVAVGRDGAACERIRRDVRAHGVRVAVARGEIPAVLDHLPAPDAVFLGDVAPEQVRACAARALRTVVVAIGDAGRVRPVRDALEAGGLTAGAVSLRASRLWPGDAPTGETRGGTGTEVCVVWGERHAPRTVPAEVPAEVPAPRRAETIAELPDGPSG